MLMSHSCHDNVIRVSTRPENISEFRYWFLKRIALEISPKRERLVIVAVTRHIARGPMLSIFHRLAAPPGQRGESNQGL